MSKSRKIKDLPYKSKGDLTKGSVKGHLIRLTIPMIWGVLSIISVQVVDMYFISRLGTKELAAVSFIFPVSLVLTHLSFGLSIAIASSVSRLIGEKKTADVKRVVAQGMMMGAGFSVLMALACFALAEPLFTALGADDAARELIMLYWPLWLAAFAVMSVPVNGNAALRAGGDAFRPALVMSGIALVNLALNPVLIFGLLGFPALGVMGSALATLIAYASGLVLQLAFLIRRRDLFEVAALNFRKFGDSARRLCVIAVPAGIANIIVPFTNTVIVGILAYHGAEAVAGYGVATRVEAFALIAVISLAVGMTPIIGQNWGAGKFERVHETLKIAIGFNMVWSLGVAVLLGIFAPQLAAIFSDDPRVIEYATMFFRIVPCSYAFGNLVMGWSSAFNAMGHPARAFVMMVTHAVVLTFSVYLGNTLHGAPGMFIAIAVSNIAVGTVFHFLSRRACLQFEESEEQ